MGWWYWVKLVGWWYGVMWGEGEWCGGMEWCVVEI